MEIYVVRVKSTCDQRPHDFNLHVLHTVSVTITIAGSRPLSLGAITYQCKAAAAHNPYAFFECFSYHASYWHDAEYLQCVRNKSQTAWGSLKGEQKDRFCGITMVNIDDSMQDDHRHPTFLTSI